MQPVTIMENRPSRAGYCENDSAGAVTCASVFMIVYAIGLAVCGAIVFVPFGVYSTFLLYPILAFAQGGLYLLTALFGFGTICRYTPMIKFFSIACILSAVASLGGLGYYCYQISIFVVSGSFENCQEACLYVAVPVCVLAVLSVMAFLTIIALVSSIYCCSGISSSPQPSTLMVTQPPTVYAPPPQNQQV